MVDDDLTRNSVFFRWKLSLVTFVPLSAHLGVLSFAVTMLLGALFSLPSLLLDCTEPSSGNGTPTTSFSKGFNINMNYVVLFTNFIQMEI